MDQEQNWSWPEGQLPFFLVLLPSLVFTQQLILWRDWLWLLQLGDHLYVFDKVIQTKAQEADGALVDNVAVLVKGLLGLSKKELSSAQQAQINLPFITADATGPKHLDYTLTRAEFERITRDLLDRCKTPVTKALQDAGLQISSPMVP